MKITVKKDTYNFDSYIRLDDLAKNYKGVFYGALVNNRLRELNYYVDYDANVRFLDYKYYDSTRIYATSMRYLVAMAFRRVYPDILLKFSNSISMGIYGRGVNQKITKEMLVEVEKEIDYLIEKDFPIFRRQVSIHEAMDYYKSINQLDKVETLKYRNEIVNVYECYGYRNYMFGYMVPSTKYLKEHEIHPFQDGFLVQYPRREEAGEIPEFSHSPKFFKILEKSEQFNKSLKADMIHKINKIVENEKADKFIKECELRHNQQIDEIVDDIIDRKSIRLIAIAGPSSSGKTTFSNRLREALKEKGIKPFMISIDNYYKHPSEAPKDEHGKPDLEHLESLDVDLFNKNIKDLINGETVTMPRYNFTNSKRYWFDPISIDAHTPIIIEGIHALNKRLTNLVSKEFKYKIYISPFAQINIDNLSPINITDIRLLRRIVRDLNFRNTLPEKTLEMWPSVRRGEYRWIYPNIENADYIFSSELTYEFSVLKKYAMNALKSINHNSEYFVQANRLMKFLKYFIEIEPTNVPHNSLLREFIGGSIYEH